MAYQFKVSLQGSSPQIWRRVQVPDKYTFDKLHSVIQCAMGWENCHLYGFEVVNITTHENLLISPEDIGTDGEGVISPSKALIADYFSDNNNIAAYKYDFGDRWWHDIIFEKIVQEESGIKYPICTDGKNACPPEDVGGLGGYYYMLEILKDRDHADYNEILEYMGEGFHYKKFDCKEVDFI